MQKNWNNIIKKERNKEYFIKLQSFLDNEYKTKKIYPLKENLFHCFNITEFDKVKVVIIGQDPYHGPNQAHGFCFSVQKGCKIPPSLVNIYKEIASDIKCSIPIHGDLTTWAQQGVLLLNTIMSVEDSKPLSHFNIGWETFTDLVIKELNEDNQPKVFILWGNNSKKKKNLINNKKHLILEAPHPSPLSSYRGFFGCKHFSKANIFLNSNNLEPINWEIK